MYLRILIIVICCLLLTSCASYQETSVVSMKSEETFHTTQAPNSTPEDSDSLQEPYVMELPKEIDPLGFFSDPLIYQWKVEEVAERYRAHYPRSTSVYYIPNTYIGGYDALTTIVVEDDKICSIQTTTFALERFNDIYYQLKDVIDVVPKYYAYTNNYEIYEVDDYIPWPVSGESSSPEDHCIVKWDMGTYQIEMAIHPFGNMEQMAYIAAHVGDRPHNLGYGGYTESGFCCPHIYEMRFDDDCIFAQGSVFVSDANEVLERFSAEPMILYRGSGPTDWENNATRPYHVEDLRVLGCNAYLALKAIEESEGKVGIAAYNMDLTGLSAEEMAEICNRICSAVCDLPNARIYGSGGILIDGTATVTADDITEIYNDSLHGGYDPTVKYFKIVSGMKEYVVHLYLYYSESGDGYRTRLEFNVSL